MALTCGALTCGAFLGGLQITELPSGQLTLIPTSDGWRIQLGCWSGTPDQLRALIAQDNGWPEAEGDEIDRRRPYLEAALALCEVHMADHARVIDDLKKVGRMSLPSAEKLQELRRGK